MHKAPVACRRKAMTRRKLSAASFRVDRIVGCGIMIFAMGRNCLVILMPILEDGV
jgi:hypothetical protein